MNPMAAKRGEDRALGWTRSGDTAQLTQISAPFEPSSAWSIFDGLDCVKWAYTLAGYGLDDSTEEFILPFKQFVRQRPHELIAIKSLYEAAAWELCILLRGGTSF